MIVISLTQEKNSIDRLIGVLGIKRFPGLHRAIRISANYALREWVTRVEKTDTHDGWKRRYINSIRIGKQPNAMSALVVGGGLYANLVEEGIQSYDMKPGLLSGPKAKQGKDGPYNIVFMRKFTPKARKSLKSRLPTEIYELVKKMKSTKIVGTGGRTPLIRGGSLENRIYEYGSQLKNVPAGFERYAGLMKFGSKGHTQYGFFRIVSKKSKGWIYPNIPASPVFKKMTSEIAPKIKKILADGLIKDLASISGYVEGKV